jgi:hypothetical protein
MGIPLLSILLQAHGDATARSQSDPCSYDVVTCITSQYFCCACNPIHTALVTFIIRRSGPNTKRSVVSMRATVEACHAAHQKAWTKAGLRRCITLRFS